MKGKVQAIADWPTAKNQKQFFGPGFVLPEVCTGFLLPGSTRIPAASNNTLCGWGNAKRRSAAFSAPCVGHQCWHRAEANHTNADVLSRRLCTTDGCRHCEHTKARERELWEQVCTTAQQGEVTCQGLQIVSQAD